VEKCEISQQHPRDTRSAVGLTGEGDSGRRRYGAVDAYERLKAATRGQSVTKASLHAIIDGAKELPAAEKERVKALTPAAYIGLAATLAA